MPWCSSCAKSNCCITCVFISSFILILVASLGAWGFSQLLHFGVSYSVVMNEANSETWGLVPGKTGLVMLRNFTFYNFVNPMEVFLDK